MINLICDTDYAKQILPTMQTETLEISWGRKLFYYIKNYFDQYEESPREAIEDIYTVEIDNLDESEAKLIGGFLEDLSDEYVEDENKNTKYYVDETLPYIISRNYVILSEKIKANANLGNTQECESLIHNHKEIRILSAQYVNYHDPEIVKDVMKASVDNSIFAFPGELGKLVGRFERGRLYGVMGRSGIGKCHGKGTKILMYNGSIKNVEDITENDIIMGDDSMPRNIKSLIKGNEELFKITLKNGDNYTCNKSHILSLRASSNKSVYKKGYIYNISIEDYIKLPKRHKINLKNYKKEIEFNNQKTIIDPYLFGDWLGDGKGKRIHQPYLVNDRQTRLEVLAGLIDTNGHLINKCFEIATKWKSLRDDILFLARSLGFSVTHKIKIVNGVDYYRIYISGNTHLIPCRTRKKAGKRLMNKNPLNYGFEIESIGHGDYYGFSVDKNNLYLLGDFTVTHNSWTLREIEIVAMKNRLKCSEFNLEMSKEQLGLRHYKRITAKSFNEGVFMYPVADCKKNQIGMCRKKERSCDIILLDANGIKPEYGKQNDKYIACSACRGTSDYQFETWFEPVKRSEMTEEGLIKTVKSFNLMYGDNLRTRAFPKFTATVGDIEHELNMMEDNEGFIPDVLTIDYDDLILPERFYDNGRDGHDEIYKKLGGLVQRKNICGFLAIQTNREGAKKKSSKTTDIGQDWRKFQHLDGLIMLNQTDIEKKSGILRIGMGKLRDGEFNLSDEVAVLQNLSLGQSYLDSETLRKNTDGD
ncbi:Hint domain-containing homing endonuclease [Lutibacter sp.]|uniref:Hint domain-containing homing endonuclease n=1 Tax=Lutibacter sp. TaxID=1925666 RepID=UPI0025BA8170|nr:Hint domain-containing homing endonuclease [Lutibacter sp.]